MKIVVLAGGISTERDVSLCSGSMIYKALKKNGHQVMMLDVFLGYPQQDWSMYLTGRKTGRNWWLRLPITILTSKR